MENDIRLENNDNLVDIDEYFKLDFSKQTLKGNIKFKEFKKIKLKELGKDAKLFHCKNDNIYFYVSQGKFIELPNYYAKCPLCNNYLCHFCENSTQEYPNRICCIKLEIYKYFNEGNKYIKGTKKPHPSLFIFPFLPFYSIFYFLSPITFLLSRRNLNMHVYLLKIYDITRLLLFPLSFAILHFAFLMFILIISLFIKLYPIKYYIGIIDKNLDRSTVSLGSIWWTHLLVTGILFFYLCILFVILFSK